MRKVQVCGFLLLVLSIALTSSTEFHDERKTAGTSDGDVIMVNVLFRHGDRTPVNPYPLDPYRNASFWSTGWGQLTTAGMHRHYELGQWLRKRYNALLGPDYSKPYVYVQSTDVDRTLMSAESNLAGLFPPVGNHKFLPSLNWQPIPVHTVPEHLDHLLAMKKPCLRYDAELVKAKNLPEIKALEDKYQGVFKYLSVHTGSDVKTIENAEYIHSTLFIESLKNFTLPDWTRSVYPEPLLTLAQYSFAIPAYTQELRRLKGGPLVGEWIEHFRRKKLGTLDPDRKLFMYSAHDTTIANILSTFGLFERHCPPYASTILLELKKTKDDYFVALFYKNSTEARQLTIPGCTPWCQFDEFVELVTPVIPESWEKECHYHSVFSSEDLNNLSISALSLAAVLALILLCIAVLAFVNRQRQQNDLFRYQTVSTNADA